MSRLREAATRGRKVDCLAILTRPVVGAADKAARLMR
jgi:hypothetical protein